MAAVSFSIDDFLRTVEPARAAQVPRTNRLTRAVLAAHGLVDDFLDWRREQFRKRKALQARTPESRERNRVDAAVSRAVRTGAAATRQDALAMVQPRWGQTSGPVRRNPHWYGAKTTNSSIRAQLLQKLRETAFPTSEHSRSAIASGQSTTFGTVFSRRLQRYSTSRASRDKPRLYALVTQLATTEVPDFKYTTVTVNKNVVTRPHVDKYNVGPTLILALGDFKGADLVVKGEEFSLGDSQWLYFWGKDEHYNTPLQSGDKYTVTLYTVLTPYAPPTAASHTRMGSLK